MNQPAGNPQGERTPGKACAWQREPRLDFLSHLIAQEHCPAAGERQTGAGRLSALGQAPVLQRLQKRGAAGYPPIATELAIGIEPQCRARAGDEDAGAAQRTLGCTVEEEWIALGIACGKAPEHRAGDAQLADDGTHGDRRREQRLLAVEASENDRAIGAAEAEGV